MSAGSHVRRARRVATGLVIALIAAVFAGVGSPALATPPTGSVSGSVTISGVGAATGGCLTLYSYPAGDYIAQACMVPGGAYSFSSLADGTYRMRIYNVPGALDEWYDGAPYFASATDIVVSGGAATVVNPVLPAAASVSGTVTLPGGALATSGTVTVYTTSSTAITQASVGADGQYFADHLPPSTSVKVTFTQVPGAGWEWYGDSVSFAGATAVPLGVAGTTATVDDELPPEVTLSGMLVGYDGALTLNLLTAYVYETDDNRYLGGANLGADGSYSVGGLTAGTRVTVEIDEAAAPYAYRYHNGQTAFGAGDQIALFGDRVVNLGWTVTSPFTDVAISDTFFAEISWMFDRAISTGYGDRTYLPLASVSRQAMAAFMYRFAGQPDFTPPVSTPFNDVATDSAFYKEICWMADQGISTGYGDGGFHPSANVSRQAMAAFMYRFAGSPAFTPPGTSPFNDVATDSPFYAEIAWMADAAISTGYGDGGFHPTANVSRQAMAAFMHRLDGVLTPA